MMVIRWWYLGRSCVFQGETFVASVDVVGQKIVPFQYDDQRRFAVDGWRFVVGDGLYCDWPS